MSDRLLTKEERNEATDSLTPRATWGDMQRAICQAQDAKTHQIDEVEIRQATLEAVGEWLCSKCIAQGDGREGHRIVHGRDIEAFLRREMPEKG